MVLVKLIQSLKALCHPCLPVRQHPEARRLKISVKEAKRSSNHPHCKTGLTNPLVPQPLIVTFGELRLIYKSQHTNHFQMMIS
jgi:hypothetical protein